MTWEHFRYTLAALILGKVAYESGKGLKEMRKSK